MRIIKKLTKKKMPLFPTVVDFGFFTNEKECEWGKQGFSSKMIALMQQVSLCFNTKMPGK